MSDCGPIHAAAQLMATFPHPWFVSGGWAIDLVVNRVYPFTYPCLFAELTTGLDSGPLIPDPYPYERGAAAAGPCPR